MKNTYFSILMVHPTSGQAAPILHKRMLVLFCENLIHPTDVAPLSHVFFSFVVCFYLLSTTLLWYHLVSYKLKKNKAVYILNPVFISYSLYRYVSLVFRQ